MKAERQRSGTAGSETTARCSGASLGVGVGHAVPQVAVQESSPCETDSPAMPPPCAHICNQCGRQDQEISAKVDRLSK